MSKKSRQMVKEELLEAAEKLVEEMLEWQAAHPESEFEELEKLVLELRRRFGEP